MTTKTNFLFTFLVITIYINNYQIVFAQENDAWQCLILLVRGQDQCSYSSQTMTQSLDNVQRVVVRYDDSILTQPVSFSFTQIDTDMITYQFQIPASISANMVRWWRHDSSQVSESDLKIGLYRRGWLCSHSDCRHWCCVDNHHGSRFQREFDSPRRQFFDILIHSFRKSLCCRQIVD